MPGRPDHRSSAVREAPVSRLEGFSDGVFAISATLLVVSLDVPRSVDQLFESLRGFAAFALSFTMLVHIWAVHNRFFRRYGLDDGWTVALNSALLFVVLFYVFPLKYLSLALVQVFAGPQPGEARLFGSAEDAGALLSVYAAGFVAVFLMVALLYRHAWRRRDVLRLDAARAGEARFWMRHFLIYVGVGLAALAMAQLGLGLQIGAPGWIYGLLGPLCWWHGARWGPRVAAGGAGA